MNTQIETLLPSAAPGDCEELVRQEPVRQAPDHADPSALATLLSRELRLALAIRLRGAPAPGDPARYRSVAREAWNA